MVMSDDETMPLAGRGGGAKKAGSYDDRISLRGAALVFFGALLVFSLASLSARSIFPRGVRGRASSKPEGKLKLVSLPDESNQYDTDRRESLPSPRLVSSLLESLDYDDEALHSMSPVHVTTAECTGDQSIPVLKGVDFVAYWSLAGGQPAVYGSEQFSTVFQGYLFYFSSIQNKMIFESDPTRYLPSWGGFCSYGVAHEIVWNAENLGPASNPDYWLMLDGKLYLFRSSVPLGRFTAHSQENVAHGKEVWQTWFGGASATPYNTACFCTPETCVDA